MGLSQTWTAASPATKSETKQFTPRCRLTASFNIKTCYKSGRPIRLVMKRLHVSNRISRLASRLQGMLSRGPLCCRIGRGEMELGLGIHGEPGASKGPLKPVDEIVALVRDPPP